MIYLVPRDQSLGDLAESHLPHHARHHHTECGLDVGTRVRVEADDPPGKFCPYCRNLTARGKAS